jgi:thioredoxin reductase (NADPH)
MQSELKVEKERVEPSNGDSFDIVIIGSGPAGMSAALCAGRSRLKVLLMDKALPGGQASTAYKISNYLGFPSGILGSDLALTMEDHLCDYNIHFSCETVHDVLNVREKEKTIQTELGSFYKTKTIIIATGLEPKPLGASYEKQFLGRGISYYAQSDYQHYEGVDVAVIGGGNCACYAADYLSEFCNKIYLIHRSDYIKAVKNLREKVFNNPKIDIFWDTEPTDVFGIDHIEKLKLHNTKTDQSTWVDVKGVFIYVGRIPSNDLFILDLHLDENGYIITDEFMRTNIPGIFAAGDIRAKQIRQIATAVSDGMIAAINAERDLDRL